MAESKAQVGRRDVLKATAAAAAFTIVSSESVRGAPANSQVEVGVIGTGGRGKWIGNLFNQSGKAKVVAVHDYFADRSNGAGDALKIEPARRFKGLDGYRQMLAGKLDAVAIISPPYFHPQQAADAVDAGKHVYLAKPVAVDVPGCRQIADSGKKAQASKLSFLVDFQTRANEFYIEAVKRVHEGLIGKPVMSHTYYHGGRLGVQADPGSEAARLRNWVFDIALSGDIIVEQFVHVLDVTNWLLKATPVKAQGTGGRKARVDVGDCWDHFIVTYWYPGDVLVDFSGTQFSVQYGDLCVRLYGDKGTCETHYGGLVNIRAKTGGYRGGQTNSIYKDGAVTNISNFCDSIATGKLLNNAEEAANSTLTGVLGRIAAYGGKMVTWDQMMQANEKLDPKLGVPREGLDKA